jgi:hypothetical protein
LVEKQKDMSMWSPRENDDFFGEPQDEDKDPPASAVGHEQRAKEDLGQTMKDDTDANYLRAAALAFQMDDPIRLRLMEIAERLPRPVLGDKELSVMAQALAAKNEAEQRELRAAQEADELRAALNKIAERTGSDDPCKALVQIARDALTPNVGVEPLTAALQEHEDGTTFPAAGSRLERRVRRQRRGTAAARLPAGKAGDGDAAASRGPRRLDGHS